jgi:hypothetical protein
MRPHRDLLQLSLQCFKSLDDAKIEALTAEVFQTAQRVSIDLGPLSWT